jgi:hypothetical protein
MAKSRNTKVLRIAFAVEISLNMMLAVPADDAGKCSNASPVIPRARYRQLPKAGPTRVQSEVSSGSSSGIH